MKKYFTIILSLLFVLFSQGEAANKSLLEKANDAYRNNDYASAFGIYSTMAEIYSDPVLYYNLANAAYKVGDVAKAVLYYEKALKLRPFFRDASFNLRIVQQTLLDKKRIEENPFIRMADSFVRALPLNTLLLCSTFLLLILMAYLFCKSFGFVPRITLFMRPFISTVVILLLLTGALSSLRIIHLHVVTEAIVMVEEISLKVMPSEKSDEVFKLHKAAKVRILDKDGDWVNVRFGKDKEGKDLEAWTEKRFLEMI